MSSKELNGVNVTALIQTVEAVQATPALAKFRLRLSNEWIDGARNRSTIKQFFGVNQEQEHVRPLTIEADEPAVLLGNDLAPNAGEILLGALASCVTGALVYHAAARGIKIEEIESTVEGDIDLRGFLGLDKTVRNGFQNIRMNFSIRADVSDEQWDEFTKLGPDFSPVFDSIRNGVPISFRAQRMEKKLVSGAA